MLLDIRTLVTVDPTLPEGKVNFELGEAETYVSRFLVRVTGQEEIALTGPGPVWVFLLLWHAAHGVVPDGGLKYEAPGVEYRPQSAGVATGDGSAVNDGQVVVDVTTLEEPAPGQRLNFAIEKIAEYQRATLARIPAFKPGTTLPEFEVILTGPGPVWLFLALAAALHSRGGKVIYSAPNAPRVVIIDHK